MSQHDIFISYQWSSKPFVQKLHEKLVNEHNFSVWRDDEQLDNTSLNDQLASAIQNSNVILCCITSEYSESENCKKEISYANSLKKPLIILMLERLEISDLGGIGFIINPLTRFNFYNEEDPDEMLELPVFDSMIKSIQKEIENQGQEGDEDKSDEDESED